MEYIRLEHSTGAARAALSPGEPAREQAGPGADIPLRRARYIRGEHHGCIAHVVMECPHRVRTFHYDVRDTSEANITALKFDRNVVNMGTTNVLTIPRVLW